MNNILNCAVIGLGIGEQHAQALLKHPKATLAAICELDEKKAYNFLHKNNLSSSLKKSFSEILEDKNINLVSIASFDDAHFEQVIACLKQGKHVFVEKPLCQTQEQLEEIYDLWKKSGLALSSNLILRKSPLFEWLDKSIHAGEFGRIYAIDMDYLYGRVHKITKEWRSTIDDYSVMAGGGIHLIDLMTRFLGKNPIKVQSSINKIATQNTPFRYHDFHAATFYFQDGVIGRITANFGCMHKHQHVVRVFGDRATFIYDDKGARLHRHRDENAIAESINFSAKVEDKGALLTDFIDTIFSNDIKNTNIEFDVMSAVIAADQAIKNQHCPIDIAYLN